MDEEERRTIELVARPLGFVPLLSDPDPPRGKASVGLDTRPTERRPQGG